MTRLLDHDFEGGLTKTGWTISATPPAANAVVVNSGTGSMLVTPSGTQELVNSTSNIGSATLDTFTRFYFYMDAAPSAAFFIFGTFNSVSCYVRVNVARTLSLMSNTTAKVTGSTVLALNTWYYIEVRTRPVAAATGQMEVRINGVTEGSDSTMALGTTTYKIYFGCVAGATSSGNFYFDDIAINSTAGAAPDNTWPGAIGGSPVVNPLTVSATTTFSGSLRLGAATTLPATTTFSATTGKAAAKTLLSTSTFGSTLKRDVASTKAAVTTFTGALPKTPRKPVSASATFTGATVNRPQLVRAAASAFTAIIAKRDVAIKRTATTVFVGSLLKQARRSLAASTTFTAAVSSTKVQTLTVAASTIFTATVSTMTFAGSTARQFVSGRRAGTTQPDDLKNSGNLPQ